MAPLASSAPLLGEIVLTGTYDWAPKRRDIARFLQEFAALPDRPPLLTAAVTAQMTAGLGIQTRPLPSNNGDALRFGLITDRFEAGHKLKTLAYIADNQIVLSYTDVACDFTDVEDAAFFLRRVTSAADINAHIAQLSAMDLDQLRNPLHGVSAAFAPTPTPGKPRAARLTARHARRRPAQTAGDGRNAGVSRAEPVPTVVRTDPAPTARRSGSAPLANSARSLLHAGLPRRHARPPLV